MRLFLFLGFLKQTFVCERLDRHRPPARNGPELDSNETQRPRRQRRLRAQDVAEVFEVPDLGWLCDAFFLRRPLFREVFRCLGDVQEHSAVHEVTDDNESSAALFSPTTPCQHKRGREGGERKERGHDKPFRLCNGSQRRSSRRPGAKNQWNGRSRKAESTEASDGPGMGNQGSGD